MRHFLLLVLCCLSIGAQAQLFSFRNYSVEEGMTNSNATCFIQDQRGYIWIGTLGGGVNVFDGQTFHAYTSSEGLVGNEVRSILEDDQGRIWIGTNQGISMYDGYEFHTIGSEEGLQGSSVLCLLQDQSGAILAGTDDGGLNRIVPIGEILDIQSFDQSNGLSNNFIFDIREAPDGRIWLATFYGGIDIVEWTGNGFEVEWLKGNIDIPSELVICLEPDGGDGFWAGSYDHGIFHIEPGEGPKGYVVTEQYELTSFVGDNTVWDILLDNAGDLWIATNSKGLRKRSGNLILSLTDLNGLPNNQLLSLLQDSEGNLWIGTNGNGISQFRGEHFIHFTEETGFFLDQVYDIERKQDNTLVFGSYGSGVAVQTAPDSLNFEYINTGSGLPGNFVSSITVDTNDDLWIATEKGVAHYDGEYIEVYSEMTGLLSDVVNVIHADRMGVVWCGSKYGVSAMVGDRVLNLTTEEGLIDNTITHILEDSKGTMWFGTYGGLVSYDRMSLRTYDEMEGLTSKRINALGEDPNGNIWIATNGGGLFWLDVDSEDSIFIHPVSHPALSSNSYNALHFLNDTLLVAGFNRGFDLLSVHVDGEIARAKAYGKSDGFEGLETNWNALHEDGTGRMWFGTPAGATRFDPKLEPNVKHKPKIQIDVVKLFYRDVDWSEYGVDLSAWNQLPQGLQLNHKEKQLTFEFRAVHFSNPEKIRYQHFLEGSDGGWSPWRADAQITYPGLTPGAYTFHVVAMDGDGNRSEPATFEFVINPPWYRTLWFYALCVVAIGLLIYAYTQYREVQLKAEKEHLEKVVAERTAEVVQQKEVIELKNKDITDSITYARRIQEAILPKMENLDRYFAESMVLFMPKDIVSGDFYWFSERSGKVFFTASDCTGHGVPGAFMSMIGTAFLNESVNEKGLETPAEILDEVRKGVIVSLKQTGEEGQQKDGMDMALCAYSRKTNILEFAGANNSMYLIRKEGVEVQDMQGNTVEPNRSENGFSLFEFKANKMPVGYHSAGQIPFDLVQVKVEKNDIVYMFSDGYPDQFGGPKGKKFKYLALKRVMLEIATKTLPEQHEYLSKTILDWMGEEHEQIDDICVVGARI